MNETTDLQPTPAPAAEVSRSEIFCYGSPSVRFLRHLVLLEMILCIFRIVMPIVFLAYTAHPVRYIGLGLCFGFVVIFNVLSLVSSRLTQLWTINGTKNEYQINIVYFLVWKAISICLVLGILSTLSMAIFDEEQQNNKQEQEQSAMLNNTYALNGTTDIEPDVIPATEIANLAKSSAIYYTFDFFFSGLVTFGLFVVTWYRPK